MLRVALVSLSLAFTTFACSSSDTTTSTSSAPTEPQSAADADCTTVCSNFEAKCGQPLPNCASQCTSLAASARTCIANAADCNAVAACGQSGSEPAGGNSAGSGSSSKDNCRPPRMNPGNGTFYCGGDCQLSSINGNSWCSLACKTSADCTTKIGTGGYVCGQGVCMQGCSTDAECTKAGWKRCVQSLGSDAYCM